jgi:hypothetical protein
MMPLFIEFYSKNKYILGGENPVFHLRGEGCEFRPGYWLFLLTTLLMLFGSSRQCCKRTTQQTTAPSTSSLSYLIKSNNLPFEAAET